MEGKQIGDFQIKRKLGEGQAAEVYLVENLKDGRNVAFKVSKKGEDEEDCLRQLRNEAALMKELESEFIPQFYGYYETDGIFYNVLEFIDGSNLHDYFENQEAYLSQEDAVDWGLRICSVLDLLHNHQPEPLLYCGIAPKNLMIDLNDNIYVIDFGKVVVFNESEQHPRIGRIGYSAPEQYEGFREPRSDIYSLGVLLYHATTGLDAGKEDPENFDFFLYNPPRSINSGLSKSFEAMILKAVEHDAKDRIQDVEEFTASLMACA